MAEAIKNVSLNTFRGFLKHQGLNHIRTKGGHEVWSKKDLLRPVVLQTHIDPIPIFIISNNLRTIGLTMKHLREYLSSDN